jgi:hypothetical protein
MTVAREGAPAELYIFPRFHADHPLDVTRSNLIG